MMRISLATVLRFGYQLANLDVTGSLFCTSVHGCPLRALQTPRRIPDKCVHDKSVALSREYLSLRDARSIAPGESPPPGMYWKGGRGGGLAGTPFLLGSPCGPGGGGRAPPTVYGRSNTSLHSTQL